MGLFSWLLPKKRKPLIEAPKGVCPNCWGKQEWDKKYFEIAKDKQVDVNNKEANHAFIQYFVVNHLDGIKLKRHESYSKCVYCKAKHPSL